MNNGSLKRDRIKFNKINKNRIFYFALLGVFLIVLLISIISVRENLNSLGNKSEKLYLNALNFDLPQLENQQINTNSQIVKEIFLKSLKLDFGNPINIMNKEIAFLKESFGEDIFEHKKNIIRDIDNSIIEEVNVTPFNMNDEKQVGNEFEVTSFNEENINSINTNEVFNIDVSNREMSTIPQVLIYHSHTGEGYKPASGVVRDDNYNVCGMGNIIEKELEEKYKINVIHDKTKHDTSYTRSYYNSRESVKEYLEKYNDFNLIIDLHRDSPLNKSMVTTTIDGQSVARFMFVVTPGNPHYEKNKKVIDSLIEITDGLYPTLLRDTKIYDDNYRGIQFYNQDLSNNAILIELGSCANTVDEASKTAVYISRVIAEYIYNIAE